MKQTSQIVASLLFAVCLALVAQSKCWQALCHGARECREPAKVLCSSSPLFPNRVAPQGMTEHASEEDCHCICNNPPPTHHEARTSFHLKKRPSQPDGLWCWAKASPAILFDLVGRRSPIPPLLSADPVLRALRTVVLRI